MRGTASLDAALKTQFLPIQRRCSPDRRIFDRPPAGSFADSRPSPASMAPRTQTGAGWPRPCEPPPPQRDLSRICFSSHCSERAKNSACCRGVALSHHSGLAVMTYSTHNTASLRRFQATAPAAFPIASSADWDLEQWFSGVRSASAFGVSRSL